MTLPNFFYVGAPRAGSTWIFEALRAHPQVYVPIAKYVKYYLDEQFHRGKAWYEAHFEDARPEHAAIGEVSTGYLYSETALQRIAEDLPDARIVISLRNPIERDWSAYLHMKRNSKVNGDFSTEMNGQYRFISEYGRYDKYLPAVLKRFPKDNIHVMFYDDLVDDAVEFGANLYRFLEVDPSFYYREAEKPKYSAREARSPGIARLTKNLANTVRRAGMPNLIGKVKRLPGLQTMLYTPTAATSHQLLSSEDRMRLIEKHKEGISRLEEMVGRDLSHWMN